MNKILNVSLVRFIFSTRRRASLLSLTVALSLPSLLASSLPAPPTAGAPPTATPLSGLVKKFTEKRQPQATPPLAGAQSVGPSTAQPVSQPFERPVATEITLDPATKKAPARKPSPPLASLPAPKAAGPLRILVVDDDWDNNSPDTTGRLTASDEIFRALVAGAVGGDAAAWSVVIAERYKDGPTFEQLRRYNVVLWYTGASHGADPSGVSTLSREDEKTVRRYLQEVGGSFILVSPGYANNLAYATSWTDSPHPFLKEVVGVNGLAGFVQRGAGTVSAHDGSSYTVQEKGAAEALFSAVNPDGSAIVFTSKLDPKKTAEGEVPVAVAHPFGGGRFVYVGFTFENIPEAGRAKAFGLLLDAATGPRAAAVAGAPRVTPTVRGGETTQQRIVEPPPARPGPPVANLEISRSYAGSHGLRWIATLDTGIDAFEVFRRDADGWRFLRGGFRENFYDDPSFVAPGSAYKVVAVYRDGRRGEAVVEYPNPPQPQRPTGLKVVQTAPEKVQIDWVNVPGVGKYRIYGPGAPAAGVSVTTGTPSDSGYGGRSTMTAMPIGIHEIRVAAEYAAGPAPIHAAVNVAVNSDRGRYRLVFLGVKVTTPVHDDIVDADGRGNEIYGAAFWATTHQTLSEPAAQGGFARTLVHGDTANFPARVRAGSAGPTGGLRAGDFVPSPTAQFVQPGVAGESDRFPLKLWEGELVDTGPIVAVIPIVFEWNATFHTAWDDWANYWSRGGNILEKLGGAMRANLSAPLAAQPLFGTWTVYDPAKTIFDPHEERPSLPSFKVAADRDRPIGLINTSTPGTVPDYGHKTVGFTLTRRRVEAALAGQTYKILQLPWSDAVSGAYIGFFQLERLSAPPLIAPPTPGLPPVIATGTTLIVPTVSGTVAPAQPATPAPSLTSSLSGARTSSGQTIKPVDEPPPGPPPTNVLFTSEHAARHTIRWQGGAGATFDVFRKQGDQWITVAAGTTFSQALDESFVTPGTVYQVGARYPDGRFGRAEATFANPAQPVVVTELKMTQTGERRARLTWKWASGTFNGFRVFAPGLPADGQPVAIQQYNGEVSHEIANVPEGPQLFRVACQYGTKVAPIDTRLTATVATWSGQYRAVLLGFSVGRKTVDDDVLDGDGRGDEVFFAAYRALITNPAASTVAPLGVVQSAVHGDTNNFSSRIRAGTAGPTGGVRSGDAVPSAAALTAQPGIGATTDRLPLLLWEGGLRNDSGILALAVSGFEWDNGAPGPLNSWINWWNAPNGRSGLVVGSRDEVSASPEVIRFVPFALTYEVEPAKPLIADRMALPPPPGTPKEQRYVAYAFYGRPIATRPIGVLKSVDPTMWYCVPHGFALTRRNIEATLGAGSAAVVSGSLAMRRGPGANKPEEQDEAEYTVYVQIERTSAPPITAP